MVKKIKVVEMNQPVSDTEAQPVASDPEPTQTVEEPVQTEEAPPKKARQPREPRAPKQPRESKVPDPPVEDPPSDGDSINTEEIMTVISEHRKKKLAPEPVAQEPPPSVCKDDIKVSCPDCKKDMSAKSLKYSHAKNCKAKPAPPPPPPPEPKKRAQRPKKPQVVEETQEQYLQREVVPTVQQLILAERAMRQGVRKQKFQALLSDAFHS